MTLRNCREAKIHVVHVRATHSNMSTAVCRAETESGGHLAPGEAAEAACDAAGSNRFPDDLRLVEVRQRYAARSKRCMAASTLALMARFPWPSAAEDNVCTGSAEGQGRRLLGIRGSPVRD